ncbi:hypothetical protein CathTA2_3029 [Caldalkalibacillus thermarum TA2.A1]|uniref:Uncharacterized protein n=1 Tax=Caldalkalibacillus thermarum (strain TA2.A1) TaxID=986075 RepID=F5LAU4_CALTT|nr:hypothetical protein CathTA2_3029 [Caldalkalibacillus thermarum TA2.A1]
MAHQEGGGRVVVPQGTSLTGPIHLKSNVNLHLSKQAIIKFSQNPDHFLPVVRTSWEGVELYNYSPLIYAYKCKNIAITGFGTLGGQGDKYHWWPWKSGSYGQPCQDKDREILFKMAEKGVPVEARVFGRGNL